MQSPTARHTEHWTIISQRMKTETLTESSQDKTIAF